MNRGRPDTAVRTNPQACGRQHASWETEGDDGVLRLHETTLKILRKRLQRRALTTLRAAVNPNRMIPPFRLPARGTGVSHSVRQLQLGEAHTAAAMGSNLVGSLGRLCRAEPGDLYAAHAHGWARLTDVRQVAEMSAFP